jgi:hypothetical protein
LRFNFDELFFNFDSGCVGVVAEEIKVVLVVRMWQDIEAMLKNEKTTG